MLEICHECEIHHYENCPSCFGFGVYGTLHSLKTKKVPVSAGDALDIRNGKQVFWEGCGYCHSTPWGIPKDVREVANV